MIAASRHRYRSARRRRAASAVLCAVAVVVAGCLPRVRPDQAVDVTTVFTCGGDYRFSVRELGEVATVRAQTQTVAIPRIRSASGTRYRTGDMEFWHRGQTATLRFGGETHADCAGQVVSTGWDEARLLGVDYRAAGNEPTWSLEIDDGKYMRFMVAGGSPIYTTVPQPTGEPTRRVYHADAESQALEVIVEERPCRNATSTDPFPHTVTVTLNGFPYSGCGRALVAS